MMNKVTIILIVSMFCLMGSNAQAQDHVRPSDHIRQLKEGVLLVRLSTKDKVTEALEQNGKHEQAEQIKAKNRLQNLEIVRAVKENFDYCPTYFFYSRDSKHVMNGALDSVAFLNDSLDYDSTIKVQSEHVYTAEIGLIEQNTEQKQRNLTNTEEQDPDYAKEPKYYGGANMRFQAFIIKDDQFKQLKRPFPYYSRTLNSFFIKKKLSEVLENMNEKLYKFYSK